MIQPVRLKLIRALVLSRKPLTLCALARASKVDKQLVAHHLPVLISEKVVLKLDGGLYAAQRKFRDKHLMDLMEPFIYDVLGGIDVSSPDELEDATVNFLSYFFALQDLSNHR